MSLSDAIHLASARAAGGPPPSSPTTVGFGETQARGDLLGRLGTYRGMRRVLTHAEPEPRPSGSAAAPRTVGAIGAEGARADRCRIQAQYAPSTYIRLYTSLNLLAMIDLDRCSRGGRSSQHPSLQHPLRIAGAYWPFCVGITARLIEWWPQTWGGDEARGVDLDDASPLVKRSWPVEPGHAGTWTPTSAHGSSVGAGHGAARRCHPRGPGTTDGQTSFSSGSGLAWAHHMPMKTPAHPPAAPIP